MTRERCEQWKAKGSRFCRFHGGHKRKDIKELYTSMPSFYARALTRTMQEALEEAIAISPAEQLQLYEELALLRLSAKEAVKTYSIASQAVEANESNSTLKELRETAAMIMRDHLTTVVSVCEAAARCEAHAKDKVSVHQLHFFVHQIVRCAHEAFGDDDRIRDFEHIVHNQIKLPSTGAEGTTVTPDMDVTAMDAMIPSGSNGHAGS